MLMACWWLGLHATGCRLRVTEHLDTERDGEREREIEQKKEG